MTEATFLVLKIVYVKQPFTLRRCTCRPHPAVWRVVHGIVLIYLLILVFMLFLTADQARQMLKASTAVVIICKHVQLVEDWH